jgi:hypothetical protein
MKCLIIILILLSASAMAESPKLLKCLGNEEKELHLKKITGPTYELNQRLIAEMVQIPDAMIDENDYKAICAARGSESWKLLQLSIVKGKNLFTIPDSVTGMQRQIAQGMVDEYVEATNEILLNFLTQIQSTAPTPNCLEEEIPQLRNFFFELKHLQTEVDTKKIFEGRDLKIFNQLKDYPQLFQRCLERLKKKPKSEPTSSPR